MDEKNEVESPPRYRWPWFVLGMVVLGFLLAIIWMGALVHGVSQQRDFTNWPTPAQSAPPTNSVSTKTN